MVPRKFERPVEDIRESMSRVLESDNRLPAVSARHQAPADPPVDGAMEADEMPA